MRWVDVEKYRRDAISTFAPGSGCWTGEAKRPAMIVAKEDMLWFLKCAALVEMSGAAGSISEAMRPQQRFMEDWLNRFESILTEFSTHLPKEK